MNGHPLKKDNIWLQFGSKIVQVYEFRKFSGTLCAFVNETIELISFSLYDFTTP